MNIEAVMKRRGTREEVERSRTQQEQFRGTPSQIAAASPALEPRQQSREEAVKMCATAAECIQLHTAPRERSRLTGATLRSRAI